MRGLTLAVAGLLLSLAVSSTSAVGDESPASGDADRPHLGLLGSSCLSGGWRWWERDAEPPPTPDLAIGLEDWRLPAVGSALGPFDGRRVRIDLEVVHAGRTERFQLRARTDRRALVGRTRALRFLVDYSAELACDNSGGLRPSAIGDPLVESLLEGVVADVRPHILQDGRIALEAVVQAGQFDPASPRGVPTRARFLGRIDLPAYGGALAYASGTRASGEPLVIELDGPEGAMRVRLVPHLEAPRARAGSVQRVRLFDLGFLLRPGEGPGLAPPRHRTAESELPFVAWHPPVLSPSAAFSVLRRAAGNARIALDDAARLWLEGDAASTRRVRRALRLLQEEPATSFEVEVAALVESAVVARARVPVLTGRRALLRFGRDRALLLETDPDVG